jgi:hypothetical protein
MMNVSIPILRANSIFRYTAFGDREDESFSVIYTNDGMKVIRHIVFLSSETAILRGEPIQMARGGFRCPRALRHGIVGGDVVCRLDQSAHCGRRRLPLRRSGSDPFPIFTGSLPTQLVEKSEVPHRDLRLRA